MSLHTLEDVGAFSDKSKEHLMLCSKIASVCCAACAMTRDKVHVGINVHSREHVEFDRAGIPCPIIRGCISGIPSSKAILSSTAKCTNSSKDCVFGFVAVGTAQLISNGCDGRLFCMGHRVRMICATAL